MKKILAMLLTLFFIAACSSNNVMSGYNISKNNHFVEADYENLISDLENRKEGIYYFGFADCPFCQSLVPILEDVLSESDKTANYIDLKSNKFTPYITDYQSFDQSLPENLRSNLAAPYILIINESGGLNTWIGTAPTHNPQLGDLTSQEIDFIKIRLKKYIK